jgi:hypothetical protein
VVTEDPYADYEDTEDTTEAPRCTASPPCYAESNSPSSSYQTDAGKCASEGDAKARFRLNSASVVSVHSGEQLVLSAENENAPGEIGASDEYARRTEGKGNSSDLQPPDSSIRTGDGSSIPDDEPEVDRSPGDTSTKIMVSKSAAQGEATSNREQASDGREQHLGIEEERDDTKRKHGAPVNFTRIYDETVDMSRPSTLTSFDVRPNSLTFDEFDDDAETTSESSQAQTINGIVAQTDLSPSKRMRGSALLLTLDSNDSSREQISPARVSHRHISDPEFFKARKATSDLFHFREFNSTEMEHEARRVSSQSEGKFTGKKSSAGPTIPRALKDQGRSASAKLRLRHEGHRSMMDVRAGSRFTARRSSFVKGVSSAEENQSGATEDGKDGKSKSAGSRLIARVRSTYHRLDSKEAVQLSKRGNGSDDDHSQKLSEGGTKLSRLISFRNGDRDSSRGRNKWGSGHSGNSIRRLFALHRRDDSPDDERAWRRVTDQNGMPRSS